METLLTIRELAAACKVTEQTIQRFILRKEIPYRKIKRMVRFRPSEINEWINNGGGFGGCAGEAAEEQGVLFNEPDNAEAFTETGGNV
jgi:excisionase family DNA binding protein